LSASSPDLSPRGTRLAPADAAIFETFVVPRYLALFGELLLESVLETERAAVVHLGCRTGYPDRGLAMRLPGARIYGLDESVAALELARAKAATMPDMRAEYLAAPPERALVIAEAARLLAVGGQLLFALPMRGSFGEIADLLRECALKLDDAALMAAVDRAMQQRPTVEALAAELEEAGLGFVDVGLRPAVVTFPNGRAFLEDPITRLLLLPEFRKNLGIEDLTKSFNYVREAIDKYWSEGEFELTVNVGCATARR
jgi:SAM-dependent methyltransferase